MLIVKTYLGLELRVGLIRYCCAAMAITAIIINVAIIQRHATGELFDVYFIGYLVLAAQFIIVTAILLIGVCKRSYWTLMLFIFLKATLLSSVLLLAFIVILPESVAMFFYLLVASAISWYIWVCAVSYLHIVANEQPSAEINKASAVEESQLPPPYVHNKDSEV